MHRELAKILGVKVDSTPTSKVLRFVYSSLKKHRTKFIIVTPNPEQVILAQEDSEFKKILNLSNISLPDGIGLVAAIKFYSLPRPKNPTRRFLTLFVQGLAVGFSIIFDRDWVESELKQVKGREIFLQLIKLSNKNGWKVALLGDKEGSAQKSAKKLQQNYIQLKVLALGGPNLNKDGVPVVREDEDLENKVVERINQEKPDLLFIGFGAPKQEKWLARWIKKLDIGGAMVVGGTFDYVSGKTKLPPKWVSQAGLEWIWRLLSGSQKPERIFTAFPEFPLSVFWEKFNRDV